jgi:hypothetical protein
MTSYRKLKVTVNKREDYRPISKRERKRVTRKVMRFLFSLAEGFDGDVIIELYIKAKGNA